MRDARWKSATACILAVLSAAAGFMTPTPARAQDVAFETVVARLKSPEAKDRADALALLNKAGYLEAVPAIAPLLTDPDPKVQGAAVETVLALYLVDAGYTQALGRFAIKEKGATLALFAFVQGPGATIPNLAPPPVIRGLIEAIGAPTASVRFDAAYALAVLGKPLVLQGQFPDAKPAMSRLLAMLGETDPVMRQAATNALGRLLGAANERPEGNAALTEVRNEAGDRIVTGLNDADQGLRLASMGALGEMRYDRGVQSLTDLFNYYKRGVDAFAAFDAVARIAHPGSLPVLLAQLGNREPHVRRLAIEGIARLRDAEALAQMDAKTRGDQSAYVGHARAFAKARNGDFSQMTKLVEGFKYSLLEADTFAYLVELGATAAGQLSPFSTHKDDKVRAGVAEVLGIVGTQTSLGLVEVLMRDKRKLVADAAARSQKRLVPRISAVSRVP